MSTETVLTGEQIDAILASTGNIRWTIATKHERYALFARAIEQAVLQSEQVQAWKREAQQWISVDDCLPEPETDVLVKCSSKFGRLGFDIAGLFRGEWMSQITEADCRGVVTHWMPLPAPPTE